ncbi:DUF4157 domain-containing protein [Okeania sp. SIO2B3]|uniref:eCIS core domain-containing protein n=1 Tax=Okeania sp. SIO2B3 TaxID=2607784 RepID=UPI0025D0DBC5|nr:DUF4157 domain-containing protein [Okeania sp. SIO2B3]
MIKKIMGSFCRQKVRSSQVPNIGQRQSIFQESKFPPVVQNITATSATTDLSEYRKPQTGEMIANVMGNLSQSNSSPPPSNMNGKQLQVPRPEQREGHIAPVHQLKAPPRSGFPTAQVPPNKTGLPDRLKAGVENLSGYSLDNVRVHYNSSKPAQLQALAYTQGTDIHVAPGQEKHLPHEAWHVVQQMQGRVKPTMQMKGNLNVNDDAVLEKEADVMGGKIKELSSYSGYTVPDSLVKNNFGVVGQQTILNIKNSSEIQRKIVDSGVGGSLEENMVENKLKEKNIDIEVIGVKNYLRNRIKSRLDFTLDQIIDRIVKISVDNHKQINLDENCHQFETVNEYVERTGVRTLYRSIRSKDVDKDKFELNQKVSVPAEIKLPTSPGERFKELKNLHRHPMESHESPKRTKITNEIELIPGDSMAQLLPADQVSGSFATQFISTSSNPLGAIVNTVKNWDSGSNRTRMRPLRFWDPVVKIDLTYLLNHQDIRIYDMKADYIEWPNLNTTGVGVKANAEVDNEILISGKLPPQAVEIYRAEPGRIALDVLEKTAQPPSSLLQLSEISSLLWYARDSEVDYVVDILNSLVENNILKCNQIVSELKGEDKKDDPSNAFISALKKVLGKERAQEQLLENEIYT